MEDNKEFFKIIYKAVNGDITAKFEIIMEFEELINKHSKINGVVSQDAKEYIEERAFKGIEDFNKIKNLKNN